MFQPVPFVDGDEYTATEFNDLITSAAGATWLPVHFARNRWLDCHSVNGATVVIHPYLGAVIQGEFYDQNAYSGASVTVADLAGGGSFANNTWYYVYAKTDDPSPAVAGPTYIISPTAPDASLTGQSDGFGSYLTAYPYVCAFRTNGSGAIVSFQKTSNRTRYDSLNQVFTTTTAGTDHALTLTEYFPPHAKGLVASLTVLNPATALPKVGRIRAAGTTGANTYLAALATVPVALGRADSGEMDLPFQSTAASGASADFTYDLDAGATLTINCHGWWE